ncbi:MAG: FapA family protein [Synergistaceae bacterium]|nr:FapA family protein [Synergistaceae bacterium]
MDHNSDISENSGETKEAVFRMKISDDALTCEMLYIPPQGDVPLPTIERVKGEMNSRGVVFGHDEDAIKNMLEAPVTRQWVVTAKGDPPENGRDAKIDYKVDLNILKPKAVGDRVDMRELGAVINVTKGQLIAEKIPAFKGKEGTSVMGRKINVYMGKDKNLSAGKGTLLSEDKTQLFADCDGNLYIKDQKLTVNPTFEVNGDVDYSVGNIDFIGPVTITGSIREGFEVASGNVLSVGGVVEGATLSAGGDMLIKTGVRGAGKAKLVAKENVIISYIDQAFVRAGRSVKVAEVILNSDIGARFDVVVGGGKKGQIVGGRIVAGSEVVCEILGSEMEPRTDVTVGQLPEIIEERRQLQENLKLFDAQVEKIDANIDFLKDLQKNGDLKPDKQELLAKMTKAKFQIKAQYSAARERMGELERDADENRIDGCVRVRNVCYPGVLITIRGIHYVVRERLRFVKFVYEDGEIKIKSFE